MRGSVVSQQRVRVCLRPRVDARLSSASSSASANDGPLQQEALRDDKLRVVGGFMCIDRPQTVSAREDHVHTVAPR